MKYYISQGYTLIQIAEKLNTKNLGVYINFYGISSPDINNKCVMTLKCNNLYMKFSEKSVFFR